MFTSGREGAWAGLDLRNREACDRAEALGRLARLRDARVARDRQEDERVLHREAVLVDEHARRLFRDELERIVEVVGGGVWEPALGELGDGPRRLLALQHVE